MELRARFDERNNIEWAQRLEEAGCRVIYGLAGYKVHSKVCLITRKEFGKIQYITQFGTGNYNEKTAKQYTDLSLITANQEIGRDAAGFFSNLMLGNLEGEYKHLWVAPNSFKNNILQCVEEERQKSLNGAGGCIIIKCNSLTDKEIIEELADASRDGVKISMLVRGICCLVPQIANATENIRVISIVGKFLEHSRIFCFGTGFEKKIYISSADLMTRNTERRVEVACPILDPDLRGRIWGMLEAMLRDNTQAWEQFSDGRYVLRCPPGADIAVNSQEFFTKEARVNAIRAETKNGGSHNNDGKTSAVKRIFRFVKIFFRK
jgi:polyphosphate kinase